MGKSKQKQTLALLMSAALLIGQPGTAVYAEGAMAAPLTDFDGLNETVKNQTVQADTELNEPTPLAAPDEQGDVLTVTFNSSGGTNKDNNEMKAAIDAALLLSGKDKADITTIRLNGNATEITEVNWHYLLIQYNGESGMWPDLQSDWDNLNALDLSGMTNLKAVRTGGRDLDYDDPDYDFEWDIAYRLADRIKMNTLALPDSLTEIGEYAFQNCVSLTMPELPAGLTKIGDAAFKNCTNLALKELPAGLTKIGDAAFENCTNLVLKELPAGMTQIGYNAFLECTSLTLEELPAGVTEIGTDAFSGCTSLALETLPAGITQIEGWAFSGCTSLALETLPADLEQIGQGAFAGCTSLALKELPAGVKQIGYEAFFGCTSLALEELPAGLKQIEDSAFYGCTNMERIIMRSTTAPTLEEYVFADTSPELTIYIPKDGTGYDSVEWEELKPVPYSPTTSISLPATLELESGESDKLTAGLAPDDAIPVVLWISDDTGVATMAKDGTVTAIAPGKTTITAVSLQDKSKTAVCVVTVPDAAGSGSGGSGGSSGGSGSGGSGGSGGGGSAQSVDTSQTYTLTSPQTPKPGNPMLAVINLPVTVENGTAIGKLEDGRTAEAISAAERDAKAKINGIAVQYNVKTASTYEDFSITVGKTTLDRLTAAKVKYATLNTGIVNLTLDLATLQEIQKQANGDISLNAVRETDLTGAALAAVGTRPAYRLNVDYTGADGKTATVHSFGEGRVTVELAYKPTAAEQSGRLSLVYSKDGEAVEWLQPCNSSSVSASVGHFSVYGVGFRPAPTFTDTAKHWAKEDIAFVVSRGLLGTDGATSFVPEGAMTRSMFVTALGRLADIDQDAYSSSRFIDVAATAEYAPYVEWAASNGIVVGTGKQNFSPDSTITREQMAAIMQKYADKLGYTLPKTQEAESFTDEGKMTASMKDAVLAVQQAGVMNGSIERAGASAAGGANLEGRRRFDPKNTATRAEAAAVLRNFLELVIDPAATGSWSENAAGSWLYYENDKPVTGWKQIEGIWYYFDADGIMAVNTKIDGYELGPDGARKETE